MKKIKKILLIIVAICVVFGIIGSLGGNDSQTQQATTENKESTSQTVEETQVSKQVETTEPTQTDIQLESAEQTQTAVTEEIEETFAQETESSDFTPLELYTLLQDNEVLPYTLNEKSTKFLSEHGNLFPLADSDKNKIEDNLIDYSLEAKHIEKNASKYGDKLMSIPPTAVIQIQETALTETQYLSDLNVIDSNGHQYYILYIGELDDIFTDDIVDIIGLPIGYSQFDNTDGGQTLVTVLAGCMVTPE